MHEETCNSPLLSKIHKKIHQNLMKSPLNKVLTLVQAVFLTFFKSKGAKKCIVFDGVVTFLFTYRPSGASSIRKGIFGRFFFFSTNFLGNLWDNGFVFWTQFLLWDCSLIDLIFGKKTPEFLPNVQCWQSFQTKNVFHRRREVHHDHKTEFQMQLTTLLLESQFYIQLVYKPHFGT